MSKSASKFQEKVMAIKFRGKEIFKPLNTGIIDERVKCVREFVANQEVIVANILLDKFQIGTKKSELQKRTDALWEHSVQAFR